MDIRLKQRLVGATVLVSLTVIFLPIVLNGPPRNQERVVVREVPPMPQRDFRSRIVPLDEPKEDAGADGKAGRVARTRAGQPLVKIHPPAPAKPAEPEPPVVPAEAIPPKAEPQRPKPRPKPAAGRKPSPDSSSAADLQAWMVQLAAFSKRDNADALVKKLRAKGYPAEVESKPRDGGTVYRVRVGPELRRKGAESLRDRLYREFKLKGLVVRFP
jgi:DedD protein